MRVLGPPVIAHLMLYNTWVIFKSFTHCVFSLKMNLFYKIHLQAFNVISIMLYHSGPTFGQVLYSCQDAFVVDSSDYSSHLIMVWPERQKCCGQRERSDVAREIELL